MRRAAVALAVVLASAACGGAPSPHAPAPLAPPQTKGSARIARGAPPVPAFEDPHRDRTIAALVPRLAEIVDRFQADQHVPSVAVAFVVDGRVAMARVVGARDLATGAPATTRTLYRIGSIATAFAARASRSSASAATRATSRSPRTPRARSSRCSCARTRRRPARGGTGASDPDDQGAASVT